MRKVGEESRKTWQEKYHPSVYFESFFEQYMDGNGLEIGYKGYLNDGVVPILETAVGVDLDFKDYDGKTLPFPNNSQDYLYTSHTLEHIADYKTSIQEWHRVVKVNGHIVIVVPHRDLYEKKLQPPSRFNGDHKRFYSAASLLKEIEDSLPINSYRVRHLRENDEGHDYNDAPEVHGKWLYEIEVVLEKIK